MLDEEKRGTRRRKNEEFAKGRIIGLAGPCLQTATAVNSQFPRCRKANLCCDWSVSKIVVL